MSCWTRPSKFFGFDVPVQETTLCVQDEPSWLTEQLKCVREQLDGKARLSDQLAQEVRILEADLSSRGHVLREVRSMLGGANAELRAAAHARAVERSEESEEVAALRERAKSQNSEVADLQQYAERCRSEAFAAQELASASSQEAEALRRKLPGELRREVPAFPSAADLGAGTGRNYGLPPAALRGVRDAAASPPLLAPALMAAKEAELEEAAARERQTSMRLKEELQACQHKCAWLKEQRSAATAAAVAAALADAAAELDSMRSECARERALSEESARKLQALRAQGTEEVQELKTDMASMANGLEQKEEDILSIQFQMADLQNKLKDQAQLVYENADAFQQASEELADKDEKLQKMKVLLSQMKDVSVELQQKVTELRDELRSSRAAYQALDEQHRAVVTRQEGDRKALEAELKRVRAEAAAEVANLKAELQRREVASAELRSSLEQELEQQPRSRGDEAGSRQVMSNSPERRMRMRRHSAHEAIPTDAERIHRLQEELLATNERLAAAEAQIPELHSALERSRLLERQAREQSQDYLKALEHHRPEAKDKFLDAAPRESPREAAEVHDVLILVDLDMGPVLGTASLSIAPSHMRSDFDSVVRDFLRRHEARGLKADQGNSKVLVRFLEELEAQAKTFPVVVKASLNDLQRHFT